ncbi:unnamed protein product [Discosporangium mesarthrocarpum]
MAGILHLCQWIFWTPGRDIQTKLTGLEAGEEYDVV